ncbi:alpha/beta hydrolase [Flavobacterium sp. xlx-214]|uniref:alpha/beta hydrolase n=1 Tax=unclassified Flavobacterium TaxID=196869 RepID=UPI0013D09EB2|nr:MULTISPECIES: alpha/beta hydrolase [unclassified Flavobacterium]MBA5791767.1 alpha/beta hydrolase [Flavobacterium sp. xlx-221]QMI83006.1 alpha/beta hydrolase [Flavobacterium sp. xlx-214]
MATKKVQYKSEDRGISATLFLPKDFSESKKYPAIVVGHPAGGVKEQTAGIYAEKMAEQGYVALAFDASFQGESTGTPRHQENPYYRVQDFSAAIDFLQTQTFIDVEKIGAIGICASGGYLTAAAKQDHRIKALITVSGVDIGEMYHKGWNGKGGTVNIIETLGSVAKQRTAETKGAEPVYLNWVGQRNEDYGKEATDGYDYYRTPRAQHPNATGEYLLTDLSALIAFRAFDRIDSLLTQPLLVIAGDQANSFWNSEFLFNNAASENKELFVIKGANHFDLYDVTEYVNQAVEKATIFFDNAL